MAVAKNKWLEFDKYTEDKGAYIFEIVSQSTVWADLF